VVDIGTHERQDAIAGNVPEAYDDARPSVVGGVSV